MRVARMGCVPAILATTLLAFAPAAGASVSPFVWTGSAAGAEWSVGGNWQGGLAPSSSEPVALEFPRLAGCDTCYTGRNNLEGLDVESIAIDDGDEYALEGHEITLGAGGLTAKPANGSSGFAGDFLELPVKLSAAQTWSISSRNEALGENGILLDEPVTGAHALTYEVGDEALLYLLNETEVGPAAISGAQAGNPGFLNGAVDYFGDVNYFDGEPVSLNHILLLGAGAFGALSTDDAELVVEAGKAPAGGIVTDSATFDSGSEVNLEIAGDGTTAGEDYSQLVSEGQVELGGARLFIEALPPSEKAACPTLTRGQTYTLLAAKGALLGTFGNAPEGGPEIKVTFAKACGQSARPMRIEYHRSGTVQTVTGTVEAAAVAKEAEERKAEHEREVKQAEERRAKEAETKTIEEAAAAKTRAEEAAKKKSAEEAGATKKHEEEQATATATKKHQEEEAAAANRKHEEETLAKGGVLGAKESSKPKRPTRAQLLARALKACKKEPPRKRASCEAAAKRKYGSHRKRKSGKKE